MRRFIKKFKNSIIGKILKAIFKILLWIIELIIIFLAIIIVTQRVTNDQKTFLGFRIYNVATGSMEPEYAVGDILISREKDPSEIEVGDNIVYLGDEGGYDGKIITHNVIKIEQAENGEYLFHTKGRANTIEDPIVHEEQLYGVIVQNNIVLAWLCKILTNRYGLYFFVIIPIVIYAFVGFVRAQGERIEQEKEAERKRKKMQEQKRKQKIMNEAEETKLEEQETKKVTKKKKVEEIEPIEEQAPKKATKKKKVEEVEPIEEQSPKKATKKKKVEEVEQIEEQAPKKATKKKKVEEVEQIEEQSPKKATKKRKEE